MTSGEHVTPNRSQPAAPESGEPHDYQPGDLIGGKFELIRVLGEGGMGTVWVAQQVVLDIPVALKLIPIRQKLNPEVLAARILQEARAAAKIAHPAICRAFDFGETDFGDPYVVSTLLHGETLGDVLDAERLLPATRAVQLLLPIIEGLVAAHSQGIVHRDVKPDNILLSRDVSGRILPKLLDFGIARFVQSDLGLTADGRLLGTPQYMAPEQARGEAGADVRTDVWSVCVVLYEMVAGRRPFDADNYNAVLWSILHEPAFPLANAGAAAASLWPILERGLEKDIDERWESMQALGEELAGWAHRQGVKEDVYGTRLRSTWLDGRSAHVRVRRTRTHAAATSAHLAHSADESSLRRQRATRGQIALALAALGAAAVALGFALALNRSEVPAPNPVVLPARDVSSAASAAHTASAPKPTASGATAPASSPSPAALDSLPPSRSHPAPKRQGRPSRASVQSGRSRPRRDWGF